MLKNKFIFLTNSKMHKKINLKIIIINIFNNTFITK